MLFNFLLASYIFFFITLNQSAFGKKRHCCSSYWSSLRNNNQERSNLEKNELENCRISQLSSQNNQENSEMSQKEMDDWIRELQGNNNEQVSIMYRCTDPTKVQENFMWGNNFNIANNYFNSGENSMTISIPPCSKANFIHKHTRAGARSRCHGCYVKNYQLTKNARAAEKITLARVDTYCESCNKPYCDDCFPTHIGPTIQTITQGICKGNFLKKDMKLQNRNRCYGCYIKNYQVIKHKKTARILTKTRVDTFCDSCKRPYCNKCFPTHQPNVNIDIMF